MVNGQNFDLSNDRCWPLAAANVSALFHCGMSFLEGVVVQKWYKEMGLTL